MKWVILHKDFGKKTYVCFSLSSLIRFMYVFLLFNQTIIDVFFHNLFYTCIYMFFYSFVFPFLLFESALEFCAIVQARCAHEHGENDYRQKIDKAHQERKYFKNGIMSIIISGKVIFFVQEVNFFYYSLNYKIWVHMKEKDDHISLFTSKDLFFYVEVFICFFPFPNLNWPIHSL